MHSAYLTRSAARELADDELLLLVELAALLPDDPHADSVTAMVAASAHVAAARRARMKTGDCIKGDSSRQGSGQGTCSADNVS
jgi:hypothetical protein